MTTNKTLLLLVLVTSYYSGFSQFDRFFHDRTLRIDYVHGGDNKSEYYFIDELLAEPYWGGSKVNLIDTLRHGDCFFEVLDAESDSVIYSRGYSTLFGEWQTTDEARVTSRSYSETVVFPFPKKMSGWSFTAETARERS